MQKFIYFLANNPDYPNEMFAENKQEVRLRLKDILADESSILRIISENEFNLGNSGDAMKGAYADSTQYQSSNDFLSDVMKAANAAAKNNPAEKCNQEAEINDNDDSKIDLRCKDGQAPKVYDSAIINNNNFISTPKFFEEAGIQFKFENGKLFRKVWTEITDDKIGEFRLLKKTDGKHVDFSKFKLETLAWSEIK